MPKYIVVTNNFLEKNNNYKIAASNELMRKVIIDAYEKRKDYLNFTMEY